MYRFINACWLIFLVSYAMPVARTQSRVSVVKIATVPAEFTPLAGPGVAEPVSMSEYYFEVNEETARARVVVNYMYRGQLAFSGEDMHGPEPTYAQIRGLTYDRSSHAVVYEHDGRKTVCAVVDRRRVRIPGSRMKSTGNCKITTKNAEQATDDGWKIQRFRAIDVYFEVR